MRSILADDPIVAPLLPGFITRMVKSVATMQSAFMRGDLQEVKSLAHTVKGSSACYGFPDIAKLASEVEIMAREGSSGPELRQRLAQLCTEAELAITST